MEDDNGPDQKILCACARDPRQDDVVSLDTVPAHVLTEIEQFFAIYKTLEGRETRLRGWRGRAEALDLIRQTQQAYVHATHGQGVRPE